MTTTQVEKTSVTVNNNSPIQDYVHPEDQTQPTFDNSPYGPVIIYRRGGWGGCAGDFRGDRLISGRLKMGGSFVTENPKGGIAKNFGRIIRGGTTQICLENEDM